MIHTYRDYLEAQKSIPIEKMERLHQEMLESIGDDPEAIELYNELVDAATKYANMRAKWGRMSREEKMDQDSLRTAFHDSTIIHFNMPARFLKMQGKNADWRMELGDENADRYTRKAIGDFGCYIVFVNSICER